MLSTLQLQACISPVCEPLVLSELLLAVGEGHIDEDLVKKVSIVFRVLFTRSDSSSSSLGQQACKRASPRSVNF